MSWTLRRQKFLSLWSNISAKRNSKIPGWVLIMKKLRYKISWHTPFNRFYTALPCSYPGPTPLRPAVRSWSMSREELTHRTSIQRAILCYSGMYTCTMYSTAEFSFAKNHRNQIFFIFLFANIFLLLYFKEKSLKRNFKINFLFNLVFPTKWAYLFMIGSKEK